MGEEVYTREDAEKAERRGWELVNGFDPDAMGCLGFLDAVCYIDALSTGDIACIAAALLGAAGATRYRPALRNAVASALMCWASRGGED